MDALVLSSTLIPDKIHIHEKNRESQETKIESIVTTLSVSFSNESLEFLIMLRELVHSFPLLVSVWSSLLSSFRFLLALLMLYY